MLAVAMRSLARSALVLLAAFPVACAPAPADAPRGPVEKLVVDAAEANGVPPELMLAIADVEGGLQLSASRDVHEDDAIRIAGVLELRHGRFDSLARGAALVGASEPAIERDLALGTEAGARVLADLAREAKIDRRSIGASIGDWAPVVEKLSGHMDLVQRQDYRARVFRLLRHGGVLRARDGEAIVLPPNDAVPLSLTIAPPAAHTLGTPEYAGAIWFSTPQANKWTPGRDAPVRWVTIHDTEGGWDASVATLQNDGGKSVHYIVDKDGSRVGQFVSEADTAWHAGNWYYNVRSIGIEHVGFASKDDYQTPMYEASAALVKDIAKRNGLGPNGDGTNLQRGDTIIAHQEVPDGSNANPQDSPPCLDSPSTCIDSGLYGGAGHHSDPGVYWEWCQYMELVGGSCKCSDAHSLFNCTHDLSEAVTCKNGQIQIQHCPNDDCVVEPNGTDDHCATEPSTSSSASATTSTGAGGAGGSGTGGAGHGGATPSDETSTGGSSLSWSSNPVADRSEQDQDSGCSTSRGAGSPFAALAALLGLAALVRRRR
jgi:uncharacterized protein (TIGR03382 family)